MKVAIVAVVVVFVALVASTGEADGTGRNQCFRDCADCQVRRCRHDESCIRTCREVKRLCCRTAHERPGSILNCNCG